jgi:alginate O-acetyltransferase complex protein AlgF
LLKKAIVCGDYPLVILVPPFMKNPHARDVRISIRTCFFSLFLAAILVAHASIASAQAVGQLYDPKPPAGSAYVRVVSAGAASLNVQIGFGAPRDKISGNASAATMYRIVPGGIPLTIEIDGRTAQQTVMPLPDRFTTVVIKLRDDQFGLKTITEDASTIDGLRAQLEFYNLVEGCNGGLSIVDGPRIFESVPVDSSRRRSINPVGAKLYGDCGASRSSSLGLLPLKSGDHFSVFLVGSAEHPQLVGQLDQTEPYRRPAQ